MKYTIESWFIEIEWSESHVLLVLVVCPMKLHFNWTAVSLLILQVCNNDKEMTDFFNLQLMASVILDGLNVTSDEHSLNEIEEI